MLSIKRFSIVLAAGLMAFGCNQDKLDQLTQKNADLIQQNQMQDSMLNDFMATFNQFEENLDQIKARENLIAMNAEDPELRKDNKDRIVEDIQSINALLEQNKILITELEAKLDQSDSKSRQLRGSIARLRRQMEEKDQEINGMKEQLADMNFTIESLNGQIDTLNMVASTLETENESQSARLTEQEDQIASQIEAIETQTEQLNTAYFVMGSAKELKSAKVLDSKKLNRDATEGAFTRVDIRELTKLPINTKKAKLLTPHPTDSYILHEEGKEVASLEITNPDRFWKASKYLVVMTN
ncbi:MAG: hypothetical protein AAFR61_26160 [Bacteroidota bacterium]